MIVDKRFVSEIRVAIPDDLADTYPYSVPAVRHLTRLTFSTPITFFVGENGIGKSTLIEAIAIRMGLNPEGGSGNVRFKTRDSHSVLSSALTISGFGKPKRSYFLRAESFYNFANFLDDDRQDPDGFGPPIILSYGGRSLHAMSHGESFWQVIETKFRDQGLYILDEPESALSPTRQLALVQRMAELATSGAQFIISTHSPILLTCAKSRIIELTESGYAFPDFGSCFLTNLYRHIISKQIAGMRT